MKKSTPRSRRHRNPKSNEGDQQSAFFSKTSDTKVQAKEEISFFQAKLEVSGPNDPAEKEADAVANNVVHGVKNQRTAGVQKKEKINRAAEKEEAATKLQRMAEEKEPKAKLQRATEPEEKPDAKLQRAAEPEEKPEAKLQRAAESEEKPEARLQAKKDANKKADDKKKKPKDTSTVMEQMIKESKGKGFALPNDTRTEMEAQFNVDFSNVRIHTGLAAVKMCEMIKAQAFAHGYDIYFNEGKYNPDTDTGQNLLAHELTHVVQQKGG
jgi:hypothetical protein